MLEKLTTTEYKVLKLVVYGLTNKEIAKQLYISESTVKSHVEKILQKFNVRNRLNAAVHAVRTGIV